MLQPKEHGEHALLLSECTFTDLLDSFLNYAGADAIARYPGHNSPAAAHWVEGPSPFDNPDLHNRIAPVFRDTVVLLVPLLLAECHDIPLPTSGAAGPDGSRLRGMLPQLILMAAATGWCRDLLSGTSFCC